MAKNPGDLVRNSCVPQFRIVDLIVLTTAFATGMALQEARANLGLSALMTTQNQWFNVASQAVFAAISGIPLVAIYWIASVRRFNRTTLIQPGHWILLSMLPGTLYTILSVLCAVVPNGFVPLQLHSHQYILLPAFVSVVSASMLLYAGKLNLGFWRIALLLCAFVHILDLAFFTVFFLNNTDGIVQGTPSIEMFFAITEWTETLFNLIISCSLLILTIVELRNRVKRDLWHWLGVLVALLLATVLPILNFFCSLLGLWYVE